MRSPLPAPLSVPVSAMRFLLLCFVLFVIACPLTGCTSGDSERSAASPTPMAYGERVYALRCQTCHQADGRGVAGAFPPLQPNDWVQGDRGRLIRLVLHGVQGEIEVQGTTYQGVMPAFGYLSDDEVAAVLTYVRQSFGNDTTGVAPEQVAAVRTSTEAPRGGWSARELREATGIPEIAPPDSTDIGPPNE